MHCAPAQQAKQYGLGGRECIGGRSREAQGVCDAALTPVCRRVPSGTFLTCPSEQIVSASRGASPTPVTPRAHDSFGDSGTFFRLLSVRSSV
jgi:hypothetical protein